MLSACTIRALRQQLQTRAANTVQQFFVASNIIEKARVCKSIQRLVRVRILHNQTHRSASRIQQLYRFYQQKKRRRMRQVIECACKIQRAFRQCNKRQFFLGKRLRWVLHNLVPGSNVLCPITKCLIRQPVFNFQDKHLYEKEAYCKWMLLNGTCPQTRQAIVGGGDYLEWLRLGTCNLISANKPLIGHRLIVRFNNNKLNRRSFYSGTITRFNSSSGRHWVKYDDKDEGWVYIQKQFVELQTNQKFSF